MPDEDVSEAYFDGLPNRGWENPFGFDCPACSQYHAIQPSVAVTFSHAKLSQVISG